MPKQVRVDNIKQIDKLGEKWAWMLERLEKVFGSANVYWEPQGVSMVFMVANGEPGDKRQVEAFALENAFLALNPQTNFYVQIEIEKMINCIRKAFNWAPGDKR